MNVTEMILAIAIFTPFIVSAVLQAIYGGAE
jgi:hypothetical protein